MKIEGWERLLADAVEAARGRPFAYGSHDCATWAFDVRTLLTGHDAVTWRKRYRTEGGAARVMRRLGYKTLEEGGRDLLGEPLPTPRLAQRGDIVLADAFGICTGAEAVYPGPLGLVSLPLTAARLAWRL